jgi:hypothetical protein
MRFEQPDERIGSRKADIWLSNLLLIQCIGREVHLRKAYSTEVPVRSKTIMMIAMGFVFGTAAILVGQRWLDRHSSRPRATPFAAMPVAILTVAVAALPFALGTEIDGEHRRGAERPQGETAGAAQGRAGRIAVTVASHSLDCMPPSKKIRS